MPDAVRRLVLACLASALLGALEAPTAVIAVPEAGDVDEARHRSIACGGCAVLISPDGLALSLEEALPAGERFPVVVAGKRRSASVVRRGPVTGAVLIRVDLAGLVVPPLVLADSARLSLGDTVWTVGNSFGVLEQDGVPALSRGIVSGLYPLPADAPPARGRGGRVLSTYRGDVVETDAAVNDGNHGGALLDDAGRLVGLVSLSLARERRLGLVVPVHLVARDLALDLALAAPAGATDPASALLARQATVVAHSTALVYLERPNGLGNPKGMPRPQAITEDTPIYDRERLAEAWDRYYHEQQVFYTDQPVTALIIDREQGLLLSAGSTLHGDAERGRVLVDGGSPIDCTVLARHKPLDLVLFKAVKPLPMPGADIEAAPSLRSGDPIAVIGRHRAGSGWTLTTGIVSAVGRRQAQTEHALHQTDALANYGNLGGPVIDLGGSVVGLVTMLGPNEQFPWLINSGVALFIDSATIAKVLPGLRQGIDQDEPRQYGMGVRLEYDREADDLQLSEVFPDTGAAAAGLKANDRLVTVDGEEVHHLASVSRIVLRHKPGDRIEVVVKRGTETVTASVELKYFNK